MMAFRMLANPMCFVQGMGKISDLILSLLNLYDFHHLIWIEGVCLKYSKKAFASGKLRISMRNLDGAWFET